ncbi:hypothetical protein SRHO_G00000780 [Serrasalmus rhombeus]
MLRVAGYRGVLGQSWFWPGPTNPTAEEGETHTNKRRTYTQTVHVPRQTLTAYHITGSDSSPLAQTSCN